MPGKNLTLRAAQPVDLRAPCVHMKGSVCVCVCVCVHSMCADGMVCLEY